MELLFFLSIGICIGIGLLLMDLLDAVGAWLGKRLGRRHLALVLLALLPLALTGCNDQAPALPADTVQGRTPMGAEGARFVAMSHGSIYGGYGSHPREVFVLTDRTTGRQYLVVTGAGCTELWTEKSGKTTKTVEE